MRQRTAPNSSDSTPLGALRLVITGFGPFGGHAYNPSVDVAAAMAKALAAMAPAGALAVSCDALAVDFETAQNFAQRILGEQGRGEGERRVAFVHLGIAASRGDVCFERLAGNRRGLRADAAPGPEASLEGRLCGDPLLWRATSLDAARWLECYASLRATWPTGQGALHSGDGPGPGPLPDREDLPAACLSEDCGDYVCNATYFHSLRALEQAGLPGHALFIHIPLIDKALAPHLGGLLAGAALGALDLQGNET